MQIHCWVDRLLLNMHCTSLARCTHVGSVWAERLYAGLRAQALFLTGGIQMIIAEVVMAALLGIYFKGAIGDYVPSSVGIGILVVVCIFESGFDYSWGPLACLVRAEAHDVVQRFSFTERRHFLTFSTSLAFHACQICAKYELDAG